MKITKKELKKIILEEYKKVLLQEELTPEETQQALEGNINKQLRMLLFMKETLKQIALPPELQNMTKHIQNAHTAEFLQQFLKVKYGTPIKVKTLIEDPFQALNDGIDSVLQKARKAAGQKIEQATQHPRATTGKEQTIDIKGGEKEDIGKKRISPLQGIQAPTKIVKESEIEELVKEITDEQFQFGHDPQSRLEKHKKKTKTGELPPLALSPEEMEEFKELMQQKKKTT